MSYYTERILSHNPSLYWRLDESDGTIAEDLSGNGRHGTYAGAFVLDQSGPMEDEGAAVDLDGATGLVTSTYDPFSDNVKRTFVGLAWRDTSSASDTLFGGGSAGVNERPQLWLVGGANPRDIRWTPDESGTAAIWANAWPGLAEWAQWALTYDDETQVAELFVNGVSFGEQIAPNDYGTIAVSNFQVGARRGGTGTDNFDGKFSEVAVFEYILSDEQILAQYNALFGPYTPESIVGEQLKNATQQLAPDDMQYGDAHGKLCSALGMPFQQLAELLSPEDPYPPWGPLFDVNACPAWALPWLAQLIGLNLPEQLSEEDARAYINDLAIHKRGTTAVLQAAASVHLTGDKTMYFRERDGGDPYALEVVTLTGETPDAAAVVRELKQWKPAGIVLTHTIVPEYDWQQTAIEFASWTALVAANPKWIDLQTP